MTERTHPYEQPEAVEMRNAHLALRAAEKRLEAAVEAMREAGWRHVGINRWEPPEEVPTVQEDK